MDSRSYIATEKDSPPSREREQTGTLRAPGRSVVMDSPTPDDAAHCRLIVRSHARTFWLASHFLPAEKRRAAYALYAFCRVADDIVDSGASADATIGTTIVASPTERLADFRNQLDDALAGAPSGPVFRELTRAARIANVPATVLYELLDGVACDCAPTRFARWDDLADYCAGVASSVGEMCTYVFGVEGDARTFSDARRHARILGVAMQLTNVLRDVGEDARNGRVYLPDEDLRAYGLARDDVLRGGLAGDGRWRALMKFEVERARALYAAALPGIELLAPDSRRCATACAVGYAGILGAIEALDYDTFSTRARLGPVARAAVLWSAFRAPTERRRTKALAECA